MRSRKKGWVSPNRKRNTSLEERIKNYNNRDRVGTSFKGRENEIDSDKARKEQIRRAIEEKRADEDKSQKGIKEANRKKREDEIEPPKNKKIVLDPAKIKNKGSKEERIQEELNKKFITGDPEKHIRRRTDPHITGHG